MKTHVQPILTERDEGLGWLASTPRGYRFRFAVQGATVEEAQANFAAAVERWEEPELEGEDYE